MNKKKDFTSKRDTIYQKIMKYLPPLYFPESFDKDAINKFVSNELCLIRKFIHPQNNLDENKHTINDVDKSLFDNIHDDIKREIYNRIRKDAQCLSLLDVSKQYIQMIRDAVAKENNILGTFYQNRGKHYYDDEISPEYNSSPIVVIHNSEYCGYGGYEAATVYELFINDNGELFCTLNGEGGEDFDEPINHVQVEGLVNIAHWMAEQHFIDFPSFS